MPESPRKAALPKTLDVIAPGLRDLILGRHALGDVELDNGRVDGSQIHF